MNVDGDDSRRRLNYYSRSSPKKRKGYNTQPLRSPLLPALPNTTRLKSHHPSPHQKSIHSSFNSSFRLEVHEISRSSTSGEILIEDSEDDEILIEDELLENDTHTNNIDNILNPFIGEQQKKYQSSAVGQVKNDSMRRGGDIRIEDDQFQQENLIQNQSIPQEQYIKIQNQHQQQTMNRQFTFGQELAQAQKAQIQIIPLTIKQVEESEHDSPHPEENNISNDQAMVCESNLEYKQGRKRRPQLDLIVIQASEEGHDYQSPKFNAVPIKQIEDKWITAEDYHFIASSKHRSILIEEEEPPSNKSSARTSLSLRPYGRSICLLTQVLPVIPTQLTQVYTQMHRKLVGDQISVEQREARQQGELKIMRMLLQLRRQQVSCEQFLLKGQHATLDERIEMNKVIIHALVRQLVNRGNNL